MRKRILVVVIFAFVCCLALLFYWRTTRPPALMQTPQRVYEPSAALSPQDTLMLLEHFNTAITEREAELESGVIEFSLNSHFLMGQKLTLQVHSVAFNIPIAVKDLLLQPDR